MSTTSPVVNRLRVPAGFLIAVLVLWLATPTPGSIAVGLPISLAGLWLRGLAAGSIRKDHTLAESGPYAMTRNPLYFGSFLLGAGFALMSYQPLAAALLVVPAAVVYPIVIRNEEAHLRRLFGRDFDEYCTRTPRFFPTRLRYGPGAFSWSRYLANREYNAALGFAAVLAVFLVRAVRPG